MKVSESQNRQGQNLNVSLTTTKTKTHSEKPKFSKPTSKEIIPELRIQLNIRGITMGESKYRLQSN